MTADGPPCCTGGDCCGPGSYCCARTGEHTHPELDGGEVTTFIVGRTHADAVATARRVGVKAFAHSTVLISRRTSFRGYTIKPGDRVFKSDIEVGTLSALDEDLRIAGWDGEWDEAPSV